MLDLLRRVAVLTVISATGVALMAPLAAHSAHQTSEATPSLLLAAGPATSTLDRGSLGRESLATLTLLDQSRPVPPESLSRSRPRAMPTPASAPMQATLYQRPVAAPMAVPAAAPPPPPQTLIGDTITGLATWYCCTIGWRGEAVVALPGPLGGRFDPPPASRSVTVCADRCASFPVVDYCDCYWGTANQKVADLSPEAWAAISDTGTSLGVITVTVHLD